MNTEVKALLLSIPLAVVFAVLFIPALYYLACAVSPPIAANGAHTQPIGQLLFSLLAGILGSVVFWVVAQHAIKRRLER